MMSLLRFVADQILLFWPPYCMPDKDNSCSRECGAVDECPVEVPETAAASQECGR
jgi:hypothetical protein